MLRRLKETSLSLFTVPYFFLKGAVSRNSSKLGNYKMPVKLGET